MSSQKQPSPMVNPSRSHLKHSSSVISQPIENNNTNKEVEVPLSFLNPIRKHLINEINISVCFDEQDQPDVPKQKRNQMIIPPIIPPLRISFWRKYDIEIPPENVLMWKEQAHGYISIQNDRMREMFRQACIEANSRYSTTNNCQKDNSSTTNVSNLNMLLSFPTNIDNILNETLSMNINVEVNSNKYSMNIIRNE